MANPRQRRKTRSSSYKAVHQSRRAKKILKKQPGTIAADLPSLLSMLLAISPLTSSVSDPRTKGPPRGLGPTYAALGLAASLNPKVAGGVERVQANTEEKGEADVDMTSLETTSSTMGDVRNGDIPKGYGRIIRDEEGNAVSVEMEDEEEADGPEKEELIEERVSGVTPETKSWVTLGQEIGRDRAESEIVQGEAAYLRRLVAKHRADVDSMARDRKLNSEQRTAGQLSRAIQKAGGVGKLMTAAS
ncbi:hypothetical protein EW146_g981 [Bondarzewia mesenterica]|uniref:Nucleolar protein 16 n=1 Tax=Bondarzewia mesenterica TaxID=1095465 RepID=A0A4S4M6N3_9AGAM|nr:hypothetical protein EW146_g981 [Bondarzewia mesenterica]